MFGKQTLFRVLLALFLLGSPALSFSAVAQNTPRGSSGAYDSLLIGVDQNGEVVTGYFYEATGWDEQTRSPRFSCAFFLYGKLQRDAYPIITWYPDMTGRSGVAAPIRGWLKFVIVNGVTKAHLKLDAEHGGCWNVHHFADAGGDEMELSKPGTWTSVRGVSAKRAYFHQAPNSRTQGKAYVVRDDAVRVFQVRNGWVEAEFGDDHIVHGWIKESDLFPLHSK